MHSRTRPAFTLVELLLAVAVIAILSAFAVPRAAAFLDAIAVRGAASDAEALFSRARHAAVARSAQAVVDIDTAAARLTLRVGTDTLRRRDERDTYGVRLTTTRPSVVYSPIGTGFGISNATLTFTRGAAAETVVVSRLGRVRR